MSHTIRGEEYIFCLLPDADREYQQITSYKKSPDYEKMKANIEKIRENLSVFKGSKPLNDDENRSRTIMAKSIGLDKTEIENTETEQAECLSLAVSYYLRTILMEKDDLSSSVLFRICSLWFANKDNTSILDLLRKNFNNVASHKFISVLPQIATRLSSVNDNFCILIERIVGKSCLSHSTAS